MLQYCSNIRDDDSWILELRLDPTIYLPYRGGASLSSWLPGLAGFLDRSVGFVDGGVLVL